MKYMLDTNTLIYFIKNKPPSVAERINALDVDDVLLAGLGLAQAAR